MYESPLQIIPEKIFADLDTKILKTINFEYGVKIDKQELIKALGYDRNQYEKGYQDRDSEIVRCKDCAWWDTWFDFGIDGRGDCTQIGLSTDCNDYCSMAIRKDKEE